jgi:hypothetical protein
MGALNNATAIQQLFCLMAGQWLKDQKQVFSFLSFFLQEAAILRCLN